MNKNSKTLPGIELRGQTICRACNSISLRHVINLGESPVANYLPPKNSKIIEPKYPLDFSICNSCNLGQIGEYETPSQIFSDYVYLSSTSSYGLNHAAKFAMEALNTIPNLIDGYVLELASNDGYLLQKFLEKGIKVLGVDPAKNVAPIAEAKGIRTIVDFFGTELSKKILKNYGNPKLIIANNVAAHVPDLIDFFRGISWLCDESTLVSIENPTLGTLLEHNLYDTIYHEHFSYLSVEPIAKLSKQIGLELFKVEFLPTHGGSFRYWLRKPNGLAIDPSVLEYQFQENIKGVGSKSSEVKFKENVLSSMEEISDWVKKQSNSSIIGYGAAAKTVTTFFAARLDEQKFRFIVDASKFKQGKRIPGTSLRIFDPERLNEPNVKVLIFPWNISEEIIHTIRGYNEEAEIWIPNPLRSV